ncbi:MAG: alkaline phosphatase D family protein [Candidatus Hydrogenedentes bacterium]|nr:alkaline phosphatase D family protein [Candidatus Hydrogenedentota bacterium]
MYRPDDADNWKKTSWTPVKPGRDFTCQISLKRLKPGTRYQLRVETRSPNRAAGETLEGSLGTAPRKDAPAPVVFTVTTGQEYLHQDAPQGGFLMYDAMLKLRPDFFVHTGDILYYDLLAKNLDLARWHWARTYSLPTNINFHRQVAGYFMKDDHDTWQDDCWPTMTSPYMGTFTFAQGQAVFLEQVPIREKTYRTYRWGKELQIWLVEGRDYRSPNTDPDGPNKTIWGAEQKAWFKKTVLESDATFRVLISPTPLVGPDRENKNDNHANAGFTHEGLELRQFIAQQKNMIVICGDRHWQYVSVDDETGLREYCCGPASDAHAGGWPPNERRPEHRYLNVIGGFLSVSVARPDGAPTLTLRHHNVNGAVLNEDNLAAD